MMTCAQEIRLLTASNAARTKELNDSRFELEALMREKEQKEAQLRELGEELTAMRQGAVQQDLERRLAAKREECEERGREVERQRRELEEARQRREELLEERESRVAQMDKMSQAIERLEQEHQALDTRVASLSRLNQDQEEWIHDARELLAKTQEDLVAVRAANSTLEEKAARLEREKEEEEARHVSEIEAAQNTKKDLWAKVPLLSSL